MKTSVKIIDREFTPSEAEAVTGVSVALQRDWRRRGILPERQTDGWSRFSLNDTIKLYVLQSFSSSGFSVKDVLEVIPLCILPVRTQLSLMPNAVAFEGARVSEKLKVAILASMVSDAKAAADYRFLVMAHGENSPLSERFVRLKSLRNLEEWTSKKAFDLFTILEFSNMAAMIAAAVNGPLFRVECESV